MGEKYKDHRVTLVFALDEAVSVVLTGRGDSRVRESVWRLRTEGVT